MSRRRCAMTGKAINPHAWRTGAALLSLSRPRRRRLCGSVLDQRRHSRGGFRRALDANREGGRALCRRTAFKTTRRTPPPQPHLTDHHPGRQSAVKPCSADTAAHRVISAAATVKQADTLHPAAQRRWKWGRGSQWLEDGRDAAQREGGRGRGRGGQGETSTKRRGRWRR